MTLTPFLPFSMQPPPLEVAEAGASASAASSTAVSAETDLPNLVAGGDVLLVAVVVVAAGCGIEEPSQQTSTCLPARDI